LPSTSPRIAFEMVVRERMPERRWSSGQVHQVSSLAPA
jgi:hypothetical protein